MIISTFTKRAALICALSIPLLGCSTDGWQSASREPAGIAPEPDSTPEAVVQVYAADAWSWRGDKANALIPQIADVVERYPWKNEYSVFLGPNSNTFPQWVIDHVDGFDAKLPFRAIGSGYADNDES